MQIFVTYGKVRWVKTGRVSSCLDMSGRNILYQKVLDLNIFGIQNILGDKTRPSSDSEAATMYKLKGQSSNMRTGQSFEHRELVRLADPSS